MREINFEEFMRERARQEKERLEMIERQIKMGCNKCSQWDEYWGCDKCAR